VGFTHGNEFVVFPLYEELFGYRDMSKTCENKSIKIEKILM